MMFNAVRKAIKFPEAVKRRAVATIVRPFVYGSFPEGSHVDIEWDNLVILDACRYDTFEKYNPFDRPAEKVKSNASHTVDFLSRNLTGDQSDTVYVTASPQVARCELRFHNVVHVWRDHWDTELRTVLPQSVTKAAIDAHRQYPDKRIVIHYMQPHYPFIGPSGQKLETHATFTGGLHERTHLSIWEMLASGRVTKSDVISAYEENLQLVLEEAVTLVENLNGKSVLTSDHGNLFGERVSPFPIKLYGHHSRIPAESLISVPRLELPYTERRSVTTGDSTESMLEHDEVASRLQDLGYL